MSLKHFIKQETVLSVAIVLAVISAFFVRPDKQYISYIDFRTLAILFSLMTVMAGLQRHGVFDRMGQKMITHAGGILQIVFVLVGLCFFGSMFITNDVSLMTFVPFTFAVMDNVDEKIRNKFVPTIVCMQTVAANLGSMMTPIGNPQNLYLYSKSKMSIIEFMRITFPYTFASLILLTIWCVCFFRRKKEKLVINNKKEIVTADYKIIVLYIILFMVCLLCVIHILPYYIVFAIVLLCTLFSDKKTLIKIDYSLLLTFTAFFIFIGNIGRIPLFSEWLKKILYGREVIVSVAASQITSNVPAALLLSGFTDDIRALVIGTNIGGLGTLIASMASLISYRFIARKIPQNKGEYFKMFTASNVIFLIILLAIWGRIK